MSTSMTEMRAVIIELKTAEHLHPSASRDAYHTVHPQIASAMAPWHVAPVFTGERTDAHYASTSIRSSTPGPSSDPRRFLRMHVPVGDATKHIAHLRGIREVHAAYLEPSVQLPMFTTGVSAIGPAPAGPTQNFSPLQTYLDNAPGGLGVRFAWTLAAAGRRGAGIQGADVEFGWVHDHEDFQTPASGRVVIVNGGAAPTSDNAQHGTAALGVGVAVDDGHGITGIAPNVDKVFCCAASPDNPANAIALAAEMLSPGDVLLIELESPVGELRPSVPVEISGPVFAAIRNATDKGILVIEPAGNGARDLDVGFDGAFDISVKDSGAIVVGAGAPPGVDGMPDLSRVPLSNCGSRVDVQGYGGRVVTTGFGDLQGPAHGDVRRLYTRRFEGTSSASAMVWGVCMLIQSLLKQHDHPTLTPRAMRDLLRETGTPQTPGPDTPITERVGPRPDLRRALVRLGLA